MKRTSGSADSRAAIIQINSQSLLNSWELGVMWQDPIVAEVNLAREKLAADCNFVIKAFFAGVRERQASLGDSLVLPKGVPESTAKALPSGSLETMSSKANPAT